jgi:hypothetical protein
MQSLCAEDEGTGLLLGDRRYWFNKFLNKVILSIKERGVNHSS